MNRPYYLSICIPTYNRAQSLNKTLMSIVTQQGFDKNIEIIISDNASLDNTEEVSRAFCSKYENIKYYKNANNIEDANFPLVLSYSTGDYVKLLSDNKPLLPGFLENLANATKDKPSIVFHLNKCDGMIKYTTTNSANGFLRLASFYSTWSPAYTFRRDILDRIDIFNIDTKHRLFQTELAFKVLSINAKCVFVIGPSMRDIEPPTKGGYNIFDVFIKNYLDLLRGVPSISRIYYFLEKNRLLVGFIFPWVAKIRFHPEKYYFETTGFASLLSRYYRFNCLLLLLPLYCTLYSLHSTSLK